MEEEIASLQRYSDAVIAYLAANGVRILVAALIVAFGFYFGKGISAWVRRICEKRKIDVTLARFFAGSVQVVFLAMAAVMALSKVGIEITPLIALLGASAFGLSLAVQGPLSNYGAGIVIIITRPFKVHDTLSVQGVTGVVDEINLGQTRLIAEDGELITVPNRKILGEILTNSSTRRVIEGVVGIPYESDPEKAIAVVRQAITAMMPDHSETEREPEVGIQAFGDSAIEIGYRVWAPSARYYKTLYAINLAVFKALREAGISIPFPQRDVHLYPKN